MSESNDNLVGQIVQQVLAAMGATAAAVCRRAAVWLTAGMVVTRSSGSAVLVLAEHERLTPAGQDYVDDRGIQVQRRQGAVQAMLPARDRAAAAAFLGDRSESDDGGNRPPSARPVGGTSRASWQGGGSLQPTALCGAIGLVVSRPDLKVQAALTAAARGGVSFQHFAEHGCLIRDTRALGAAISAGQVAGGVVIDRHAAAALLLAAKLRAVRPVQGVSPAAVAAGLRQFAANVLVLGHESLSVYELRGMIDRFAAGCCRECPETAILRAVRDMDQ